MKRVEAVIIVATALASLVALAAEKPWDGSYTPSRMHYLLYSGTLGEMQPPTRTEQKLSFAIQGPLARQMFDAIGPDLKLSCGTTQGMRQRTRGDVDCSYDKEDTQSPYTCHFGLDLHNGKSIAGAIC